MVAALDLGSSGESRNGSSPFIRTKDKERHIESCASFFLTLQRRCSAAPSTSSLLTLLLQYNFAPPYKKETTEEWQNSLEQQTLLHSRKFITTTIIPNRSLGFMPDQYLLCSMTLLGLGMESELSIRSSFVMFRAD